MGSQGQFKTKPPRRADGRWAIGGGGTILMLVALLVASPSLAQRCAQPAGPERISVGLDGGAPNGRSEAPVVSGDGCLIAFKSFATNLIESDINGKVDVFLVDRGLYATERLPQTFAAAPAYPNDHSYPPALSLDGNLVAFGSESTNFVCGDANQSPDVFVVDRISNTTVALTFALPEGPVAPGSCVDYVGGGGAQNQAPSLSHDGRYVVFTSGSDAIVPARDNNETRDVFLFDRSNGTRELVSLTTVGSTPGNSGNGPSAGGVVNADGCRTAFYSDATNIVGNDTNQARDVFLRDRCAATTVRISVASNGTQANGPSQAGGDLPAISADGRIVVFSSDASNLVSGDSNDSTDLFLREWQDNITLLLSRSIHGGSANGPSQRPSISADGRFVVFQSNASDLVDDDTNGLTDVFVIDLESGEIRRVSLSSSGGQGDGDSYNPSISPDGKVIVFQSDAANLLPDGTGGIGDIYAVSNPLANGGATPTATSGTATPTGPTATPTPTGPTSTPTPTGPTSTPTPTGPTATPTATGPTATPTATGPTVTPTATGPTVTPTATGPTVTPTATGPTSTPTATGPTATRTPTGPTATRTPTGPTATATQGLPTLTPTAGSGSRGSGGGGCGCRIDPETGVPHDGTPVAALGLPVALLALRSWRRRRAQA